MVLWSIAAFKQCKVGDRAFICKVGKNGRGIFASGTIISNPTQLPHWKGDGSLTPRVFINLDAMINGRSESILTIDVLNTRVSSKQHWTPQSSGIKITEPYAEKLEKVWFEFLEKDGRGDNNNEFNSALWEGDPIEVRLTRYERNPYARKTCIDHYGYSCSVCQFNFEKVFGKLGERFIHVHHLTSMSSGGRRESNPILDLRPVCPNCHAMIHRKSPPYSIEDIKRLRIV